MPELAEVKLTSDYINRCFNIVFENIKTIHTGKKNPVISQPFDEFYIESVARGKELILYLINKNNVQEKFPIRMTMGMTGYFKAIVGHSKKEIDSHKPKHARICFQSQNDGFGRYVHLYFVDMRRFGNWRPNETFSQDRGPDPVFEFDQFKENIKNEIVRRKLNFSQVIYNIMMDQRLFNGIGNYIRAEVLYDLDINPFQSAYNVIVNSDSSYNEEFFNKCYEIPALAYQLGGAEIKTWKNPIRNNSHRNFYNFFQCYGNSNMSKIKDKNGRMFWYNPKWNKK
jgi:endonuclease VIII-like 1